MCVCTILYVCIYLQGGWEVTIPLDKAPLISGAGQGLEGLPAHHVKWTNQGWLGQGWDRCTRPAPLTLIRNPKPPTTNCGSQAHNAALTLSWPPIQAKTWTARELASTFWSQELICTPLNLPQVITAQF